STSDRTRASASPGSLIVMARMLPTYAARDATSTRASRGLADEDAGDRRAHQVGQRAGRDRPQAELGDLAPPVLDQPAETAEQGPGRAEAGEPGQCERDGRRGLGAELLDHRREVAERDELVNLDLLPHAAARARRLPTRHADRRHQRREDVAEQLLERQVG